MYNLIEAYVNKLNKEDIVKFANKNNLQVTNHELEFVYAFIKNNYQTVLKNPSSFSLAPYRKEFSNENYEFIENLINKYKKMVL